MLNQKKKLVAIDRLAKNLEFDILEKRKEKILDMISFEKNLEIIILNKIFKKQEFKSTFYESHKILIRYKKTIVNFFFLIITVLFIKKT